MASLVKLRRDEERASAALLAELENQFPKGTCVAFMISSSQKNPSTGVVIGYRPHGYLAVRHDQAKERSRYRVRDVSFGSAQVI